MGRKQERAVAAGQQLRPALRLFAWRGLAVAAVLLAGWALLWAAQLFAGKSVKNLINAEEAELRKALFSETPHLFYCHEHGNTDYFPKNILKSRELLDDDVALAVLNCSQSLPSGKRLSERFNLNLSWHPTVFVTTPWSGRIQVPPAIVSKSANLLARHLRKALTPKEKKVKNDKEFQEKCGSKAVKTDGENKNTCILIMKGSLYNDHHETLVQSLAKSFQRDSVSVVSVDSKTRWLGAESASVMSRKYAMRLYVIRHGTRFMSFNETPSVDQCTSFVQDALKAPDSSFTPSANLKLVKPAAGAASSPSSSNSRKRKEPLPVQQPKEADDNLKQMEKESIRRDQMFEQGADVIVPVGENESCSLLDVEELEWDEDVIYLD